MAMAKADRKLMREINNMHVLQRVRVSGPISRPELSEQTGLGLSTISNIVTELLAEQLVREVGEGDSSGGRRPGLLDINETARCAFGVKIGPKRVWISLFDLRMRQIDTEQFTFLSEEPPGILFTRVFAGMERLREKHRVSGQSVLGIGVSVSGLIDSEKGVCLYSPILDWENVPIGELLSQLSGLDVAVENDVNTFAYGTLLHEANASVKDMICITTGPGVGAGIILDRRLYRGSHGGAGEFGHMTIEQNGPRCSCGRRGCLDVLASDQFLLARAEDIIESGQSPRLQAIKADGKLSPAALFRAAESGDKAARNIYLELGRNLGCGVANLINLFDPEKIVIGGEGAVAAKFFVDTVRDVATKYAFPHLADQVEIVVDDGSEDAWLQGAAALIIEEFFKLPLSS
ncbi:ROK family [Acididesulfobacillus acetoxydans]|uniref:ROK family n=1 Tax=Acididesulfobacillus acetoxydans TaxID=1561005 RepID=A0A8S0VYJ7_9FIRM|nr:ROK family protein [Acididesulfobacillus acetoxydans]CAA7603093.1 ROK family [Acididesulfobacillus acetoxydans]CEJ05669.1 Xylose repressor [Acididesulfobacillus acetoxydans]